jgi:hypothetical protein
VEALAEAAKVVEPANLAKAEEQRVDVAAVDRPGP